MAFVTGFGQNANTSLNEWWTFSVYEIHLRPYEIKYYFYENGQFKAFTNKGRDHFVPYDEGTYAFQAETNEMFLSVTETTYPGRKEQHSPPQKLCFKIVDEGSRDDGKVFVTNIMCYKDWEMNEQGVYSPLGDLVAFFPYQSYLSKREAI